MIKQINKKIIPNRILYNSEIWNITSVDEKFVIYSYILELDEEGYIRNLILESKHPNCEPINNRFCLPNYIYQLKFNDQTRKLIENLLSTFNVNNAYFSPWKYIKYKKQYNIKRKLEKVNDNVLDNIVSKIGNFIKRL